MKCSICGNSKNNQEQIIKERILNKGDSFRYLKCSKCGALCLNENIIVSDWYPKDYNPYIKADQKKIKPSIIEQIMIKLILLCKQSIVFYLLLNQKKPDILIKRLFGTRINKKSRILDVGCAKGAWLNTLESMGWKNLVGVDLFIPDDQMKNVKWKFLKGDIFSLDDSKFDLITFNHSFEHMNNPLEVLVKANQLLNKNGTCMISIPLVDGDCYKEYGTNYVQLDAPRHINMLTVKAMKYLCKKANLRIERILYDSNPIIYYMSDKYKNTNMSHSQISKNINLSNSKRKELLKRSFKANIEKKGDQAIFYIKKIN